jgi:ammonia channel protein AmtB
MLATAIMADAAQTLTTAAMGSGAISVDIIGFGAGAAVMLGASCLESRLAHSDGFSIRMGIISGLVTATTLRRFCKYPTAITFGALGAAAVAGRLALEIKRLVPDNSPE